MTEETTFRSWPGVIQAYRDFLPATAGARAITILEGNTPMIRAHRLGELLGLEVYLKFEGLNPTGSFKDRGMTVAVTMAVAQGATSLICASTGNTAASAAAYAARARVTCYVVIPEGKIAMGKLSQSLIHGARVLSISGNFDRALELVQKISEKHPVALVNSVNPHRIEGQKTAAFEVCDKLGRAPDFLALPVGNAGNITAYWKGFREYKEAGRIQSLPQMLGFQAAGAAPLVKGEPVADPQTIATAIRIGNPASWQGAMRAARDSGGLINCVEDSEILTAYRFLAREEGVFAEPASAAPVAGLMKLAREKFFAPGQVAVCVLTGHGLKDPDTALGSDVNAVSLPAELEALEEIISSPRERVGAS
ncbi:MAG: threonine synthase [Armatimonadetes bacterium]|nr:threonine synthase [Armatimonadota bacterium]